MIEPAKSSKKLKSDTDVQADTDLQADTNVQADVEKIDALEFDDAWYIEGFG